MADHDRMAPRRQAGRARGTAAREHLTVTRRELTAALRDLSSLIGGTTLHRALSRIDDQLRELGNQLDEAVARDRLTLDHEPAADEHPHKGCGRGADRRRT